MSRCTVKGEEPQNPETAPTPSSEVLPDGQHADHWVMCPGEIIEKGFKRPVRKSYRHVGSPGPQYPLRELSPEEKELYPDFVAFESYPQVDPIVGRYWTQEELDKVGKGCGTVTSMPTAIAETYAADPGYYGSTFCCGCNTYLKVGKRGEFVWEGTDIRVGT